MYSSSDRDEAHDDWWEEHIADPFIRSCVRGLPMWLRGLDRDEITFVRHEYYYRILFDGQRGIPVEWYFHGGKGVPGRHIHFRLRRSTEHERQMLRSRLSPRADQPFRKKPRRDDMFTFNVYGPADLEVTKEVIVERFNRWTTSRGRPDRVINLRTTGAGGDDETAREPSSESVLSTASPIETNALDADGATVSESVLDDSRTPQAGQGFESSPVVRDAIEELAMNRATHYFEQQGWVVEDVSISESFDLSCSRPGDPELHVEVKGTRSHGARVFLTANEVEHARIQYPNVALYVLSGVHVESSSENDASASGGVEFVVHPWKIHDAQLKPITYEYLTQGA